MKHYDERKSESFCLPEVWNLEGYNFHYWETNSK